MFSICRFWRGCLCPSKLQGHDALIGSLKCRLDNRTPLIVATIVDIDELTESSRLGRTISEQICSRLTNIGFPVVEIKMRGNIFVKRDEGELLLSREISQIMQHHNAQAVVVGTYAVAKHSIYVNLKLISKFNNVILAAHDYVLPIDRNTGALLKSSRKR